MIEEILECLWENMKNEKYLILRNYETMSSELSNGGDIDILCESREKIVKLLQAKPVREDVDVYNYCFYINGQRIAMDIREIGDEYYDREWEGEMLKKRIQYKKFYILEKEEDIYALLYHILIHKKSISDKYINFLNETFNTTDEAVLLEKLKRYMNEKGYKVVLPLDKFVALNEKNFAILNM